MFANGNVLDIVLLGILSVLLGFLGGGAGPEGLPADPVFVKGDDFPFDLQAGGADVGRGGGVAMMD